MIAFPEATSKGKPGFVSGNEVTLLQNGEAFFPAIEQAFDLYANPKAWKAVQRRAMRLQFDWKTAARHYCTLYQALLGHTTPHYC